jgi:hypothetical protein
MLLEVGENKKGMKKEVTGTRLPFWLYLNYAIATGERIRKKPDREIKRRRRCYERLIVS